MGQSSSKSSSSSSNSDKCPTEKGENTQYDHGTSHNILFYITAACAALTLLITLSLMVQHFRRYRVPGEQRQIVKIVFTPVAFAVVSLLCVWSYHVAPYIQILGELYEAFALPALFLLLVQFVAPGAEFGEDMFQSLLNAVETGRKGDTATWPKVTWICVFQYPVTELLAVIILEATTAAGSYCSASLKPRFGHFWVQIIKGVGVAVCLLSIIRFYGRMKNQMKARRTVTKLAALKGIVFLNFVQSLLFSILLDQSVLKPSSSLSYGDLFYGLPSTLLAIEMVPLSAFARYAYSSTEYASAAKPTHQPKNFVSAIFDAMNPSDLLLGIARIFSVFGLIRGGGSGYVRTADEGSYALVESQGHAGGVPYGQGPQMEGQRYESYSGQVYQPPTPAPAYEAATTEYTRPYGREGGRTPSLGGSEYGY